MWTVYTHCEQTKRRICLLEGGLELEDIFQKEFVHLKEINLGEL